MPYLPATCQIPVNPVFCKKKCLLFASDSLIFDKLQEALNATFPIK